MKIRSNGAGGAHIGMWGRSLLLMQQAGGAGGGSGGGSGGGEGGEDDMPKTKADLIKLIGDSFHSAWTTRETRDAKKRQKELTDGIAAALKASGLIKEPGEGGDGGDGGGSGGGSGGGGSGGGSGGDGNKNLETQKLQDQLFRLQKDLETTKKKAAEEEERRTRAERKAERDEELSKLRSALSDKVKPELLDDVVAVLHARVHRDPDTKEIHWKGDKWKDGEGPDGKSWDNSEHVETFDGGLERWYAGKGKHYAPARQVGGGGTGRTGLDGKRFDKDSVATDDEIGALLASSAYGKTVGR